MNGVEAIIKGSDLLLTHLKNIAEKRPGSNPCPPLLWRACPPQVA